MRVFVAGGTGHSGSYIIPELIAAGHEVTGLARSDTAAAAVSALGAKVRRGDLEDLEGLMEAAADSDGVIHVAHRQDLLPIGGMDAITSALPHLLPRGPQSATAMLGGATTISAGAVADQVVVLHAAHEAVDRAMVALNAVRNPRPPMVGEVLWMGSPRVFTLPGRYCYISRRFIERCASDAPVAFALAHEIGHHDLGHLRRAERWAASAVTHVPLKLAVLALIQLPKWVYSRHMELAADACRGGGLQRRRIGGLGMRRRPRSAGHAAVGGAPGRRIRRRRRRRPTPRRRTSIPSLLIF